MVYILIIQAVAEKVNIIILFILQNQNPLFAEILIEPLHFTEGVQTIHLGHLCFDSTIIGLAPSPLVNSNTVLVTSGTIKLYSIRQEWLEEKTQCINERI